MQGAGTIGRIRARTRDDNTNILTPVEQYNEGHKGWLVAREYHWIKERLGLRTVFMFITAVAGTTLVIVQLAAPAVKQGEINGATTRAIDNLSVLQAQAKEEQAKALATATDQQAKALADALALVQASQARIEAGVNRAIGIAEENRSEISRQSERSERRMDKISDKADAAWNWMLELKGRVQQVEAKQQKENK